MSVRESNEPALRAEVHKPTDRDLPLEERTWAGPYLFAIALLLCLAILIVIGSVIKFAETSESISNSRDAAAPTENLTPPAEPNPEDRAGIDEGGSATGKDAGEAGSAAIPGEADQ